ncbi:hypothetical protein [Streptacidiphilus rugosus]|uniref:hypothetical protein n=1 Tax=Streptacidiphilus rugosus TaxID=405783 RepID=UPI000563683B|nr:hypothetical protein [Streptacidiphilus rugosus]
MTLLRLVRRLLAAAALTAALAPAGTPATAAARTADPYHCTTPAHVGAGRHIGVALDWPSRPVAPGTTQVLRIHVTNLGRVPTRQPTLVVVHNFVPNGFSAPPDVDLDNFGTGVSFTVPARIPPHRTVTTPVRITLGASIPPRAAERCDVTAFNGADQATAAYEVVTGDPVVHLKAAVLPAQGRPGQTIKLQLVAGNRGPSNEYAGPAVYTLKAPEHTTWATPSGYRCTPDAAATTVTCSYGSAPLTWHDVLEEIPLCIDPDVRPGAVLTDGRVTATDPFDPETFDGANFDVKVTS